MVVAVAENGVIGKDGDLPWKLSSDLKRFKSLTMGKPVIMGRKCYESIGRPLPGRPNIVISRDPSRHFPGVTMASSLEQAIELARGLCLELGANEICIIGGGEIYRLGMDVADLLHVTHIEGDIDGDTYFPPIDPALWLAGPMTDVLAGEKDSHATRFGTYRRVIAAN
jgi:dihydrofolate reductase